MPALDTILQQKLQLLEAKRQRRGLTQTRRQPHGRASRGGKELISFSCNDYLGLARHPKVVAAAKAALEEYGAGAGASRLVTGNHPLYGQLESKLATHHQSEAACVFGSGYLANLGTMPALVGAGDLILMDKFVHACMLDAARLSGATVMRFAHNNIEHCRMLLEANRQEYQNCLLATETVFSMDGDRAPLPELAQLAQQYDAWLMTDAAHGLYAPPDRALPANSIRMGTLSKAVGSYGGYVCGSQMLVEYLASSARSLIYSTALPPATIAASIAALDVIAQEPQLAQKPLENARLFTSLLHMPQAQSAIVPLVLKDNEKTLAASQALEAQGYLVAAIRPPTVPMGTARLRFAFSALHTPQQIADVAAFIRAQGWL